MCVCVSQRSSLPLQAQQGVLPASLYNTMMISQPGQPGVVQIATSLAQNSGPNAAAVATFAQDRSGQIRYGPESASQRLLPWRRRIPQHMLQ